MRELLRHGLLIDEQTQRLGCTRAAAEGVRAHKWFCGRPGVAAVEWERLLRREVDASPYAPEGLWGESYDGMYDEFPELGSARAADGVREENADEDEDDADEDAGGDAAADLVDAHESQRLHDVLLGDFSAKLVQCDVVSDVPLPTRPARRSGPV